MMIYDLGAEASPDTVVVSRCFPNARRRFNSPIARGGNGLIKYKTIDTPKIDNILKIYFDVSTKLQSSSGNE